MSLPRSFSKIQKGRRIAIPEDLMKLIKWEIGDRILIEAYQGKLIVENLSKTIKPLKERLYDARA